MMSGTAKIASGSFCEKPPQEDIKGLEVSINCNSQDTTSKEREHIGALSVSEETLTVCSLWC